MAIVVIQEKEKIAEWAHLCFVKGDQKACEELQKMIPFDACLQYYTKDRALFPKEEMAIAIGKCKDNGFLPKMKYHPNIHLHVDL